MQVNGIVKDAYTGEVLPGATIYKVSPLVTTPITSSDKQGKFTANIGAGEMLKVSFVGYKNTTCAPKENLFIGMVQDENELAAVTITGTKTPKIKDEMNKMKMILIGLILLIIIAGYLYYRYKKK